MPGTKPEPAAARLEGMTLIGMKSEWKVVQRATRPMDATGGLHSVGYLVEDPKGLKAFLKAIDYSPAFSLPNPTTFLEMMSRSYNHERDLLVLCGEKRLDRIVKALDSGEVYVTGQSSLQDLVPFLVLELGTGDLRSQVKLAARFDTVVALRVLHQVTKGMLQLHSIRVAHQDLKPSNVLMFGDIDPRLSDMGSASHRDRMSPQDERPWAGDGNYTPPELLYRALSSEWHTRRLGCDAYMLGALVYFLFLGEPITSLVISKIPPNLRPDMWQGTYQEVLPMVEAGFAEALSSADQRFRDLGIPQMTDVICQLCQPDPSKRGHPRAAGMGEGKYGLHRYLTLFDLLPRRVRNSVL